MKLLPLLAALCGLAFLSNVMANPSVSDTNTAETTGNEISAPKKTNVGAIVGGVIGGILAVALLATLAFLLGRRKRRQQDHSEPHAILEKSRASSPTSHTSPMYNSAVPPPAQSGNIPPPPPHPPPALAQAPVSTPPPLHGSPPTVAEPPAQPARAPIELQSREVDEDGVSVSSFDLQRPAQERSVPRLPVYHRGSAGSPVNTGL
jgi:type IV secretory pathway VirB10-like protein